MKLKPYPEYKDSGVEWIGPIPIEWEPIKMKFLLKKITGGCWGSDAVNEGTTVLRSTEILLDGTWEIKNPAKRLLSINEKRACLLKKGDLLVTKSSGSKKHIGKTALVNEEIEKMKCCFSNFMTKLEPKTDQSSKLIYYFLNSDDARYQFNFLSSSTVGLANLNDESFKNLIFIKMSKNEQNSITMFLDKKTSEIDLTIEKDTQLIELLKEKRIALVNHVVTKGLDPTVKMKDSGIDSIGKIPEDWNITKLKYISDINYGLALELDRGLKDGTRIISLPNVTKDGRLILDEVPHAPKLTKSQEKELLLKKGDLLFNWRSGSPEHVGKTAYFNENGNFTHVSFLLRLRFNKKFNDSLYYHKYLNNLRNTGFFSFSKSKVNKTFNKSELDNLTVVVPPINKQRSIAHYIDNKTSKIDQIVFKIENNIKLLGEYKKSLIHHVVTGKVDVREVAV